jgi:putative transferase (TIGR04331 family)
LASRHLILTANELTWQNNKPVLFLGEWCKRYNKEESLRDLDYETVSYHWSNRSKLLKDYIFLQEAYEYFLALLTEELNRIHKLSYSPSYWRILLGPWLNNFICIVFDRWKMLQKALNDYNNLSVTILKDTNNAFAPKDMLEFSKLISTDNWNQFLYQDLIENFFKSDLLINEITDKNIGWNFLAKNPRKVTVWKELLKNISNYFNRVFVRENEVFLFSVNLSVFSRFLLQIKLAQIPKFWSTQEISIKKLEKAKRNLQLKVEKKEDFYLVLEKIIPKHIPIVYLEGFEALKGLIKKQNWPKKPYSIFTSDAFAFNDIFKAWAAKKVEEKVPLIISQHGGHYGIGSFSATEEHELKISNKYLTWGWNKASFDNIESIGMLSRLNQNMGYDKKGYILLVQTTVPRYSYRLYSVPIAGQWLSYFEDQIEFVSSLPEELQRQTLVRTESEDYDLEQESRWLKSFPKIKLENGEKDIHSLFRKSKLVVSTYNSTSFLETLSRNIPTVVFWNPGYWEIRDESKASIELLKSVGIFHESPKKAAEHITMISKDINSWWLQKEVQTAVKKFTLQFAKINNNLLDDLTKILRNPT